MNELDRDEYALLDSGDGRKLERFGPYILSRPSAQAVWEPLLPIDRWKNADATFIRETDNRWIRRDTLKEAWQVNVSGLSFKVSPTDFGHLGLFPEQRPFWSWIQTAVREGSKLLNLFAYSGGVTLAAAKAGAQVCHLDASKGMVAWARENAALNQLEKAPIRWIVDDVSKFLTREIKRGSRYEAIIFDPPSFGRGSQGEVFKIEEDIGKLLKSCRAVLVEKPLFVLFSCHTPGFTPVVMEHLMGQMMEGLPGKIEAGEMLLTGTEKVLPLPSGTFARWHCET